MVKKNKKVKVAKGVALARGKESELRKKKGARNALARAHYAPNPDGIRRVVYKKYPSLKFRHEKPKKAKK